MSPNGSGDRQTHMDIMGASAPASTAPALLHLDGSRGSTRREISRDCCPETGRLGVLAPVGDGKHHSFLPKCDRNPRHCKDIEPHRFYRGRPCGLRRDVACGRILARLPALDHTPAMGASFGLVGSFLGFLAIGLGMNLAIGVAGGEDGSAYIMFPGFGVAFAFAGALAGTIQWIVLRRWVPRAGWWVLISSVGWAAAGLAYMRLTRGNDVALPLGGAISGALSGGITGLGMVCLLRARPNRPDTL